MRIQTRRNCIRKSRDGLEKREERKKEEGTWANQDVVVGLGKRGVGAPSERTKEELRKESTKEQPARRRW